MLSRMRSHVFSRKGSMERSRLSKFGANGVVEMSGSRDSSASDGGKSNAVFFGGSCGNWCKNDVRR